MSSSHRHCQTFASDWTSTACTSRWCPKQGVEPAPAPRPCAPALTPVGLVAITSGLAVFGVLIFQTLQGGSGMRWELGLSAGLLACAGILCLVLSYFDRMGFTQDQAHRSRNPDVRAELD